MVGFVVVVQHNCFLTCNCKTQQEMNDDDKTRREGDGHGGNWNGGGGVSGSSCVLGFMEEGFEFEGFVFIQLFWHGKNRKG